jgi:arylsulfatase
MNASTRRFPSWTAQTTTQRVCQLTALILLLCGSNRASAGSTATVPIATLTGSRPNIVVILTDDQGYGDLSCHGNPILRTPNLDRIHAEGRRFTDFHVSPTCAPTRCALMTGRHEFKSGVTHTIFERERMSLRATTLAQVLHQAGYTNGIFGKWHLGDEDAYQPDRRGFDEVYIHGAGGIGQTYPGSCGDAPGNTYFNPALWHNGRFEKTQGYCADLFFNQALRWIDSVPSHQPLLAWISPNTPHEPLQCPPEYEARYAGHVGTNTARFFGMIANIDDNVGRLLDRLAASGRDRRTLVLFMNDNGGTVGLPIHNCGMRGGKGTPFLGATRAASFWRWPGTLPPGDIPALAAHVDVLPTLADLAGAMLPATLIATLDGRSLVPLLANPTSTWPERTLFTHLGRWERGQADAAKYRQCSVRSGPYHLVNAQANGNRGWQLYDISSDPGETRDMAASLPAVVDRLEQAYDRWWTEVLPCLENETAVGPKVNPFKERYWRQFGDGPR